MQYQTTGRKLKGNASHALPRYVIAYDTETIPQPLDQSGRKFTHKFRLGVAITSRIVGTKPTAVTIHRITHPIHFWAILEHFTNHNYTTWVVAHNILFDLMVSDFQSQFDKSAFTIEWPRQKRIKEDNRDDNVHASTLCVIDSPPTIIACRLRATGGRVVFVDTLNYFAAPLAELGVACGKHKLPMPEFSAPHEVWFDYCERDAEIVHETFTGLLEWVRENDFGMFRYTAPSQAMAAFRHRLCNRDIYFHDNIEVKKIERQSYFGGRSEVFKMGTITDTVYHYDCNALFPYIMGRNVFPCCLDRFEIRDNYLELTPAIDYRNSVAEVELKTWNNVFPCRTQLGVLYPIGEFCTTLCGAELEYAYRSGFIRRVRSWAEYRMAPLFELFVREMWRLRSLYKATENKLYESFVKMLSNSLYGKFAQLSTEWQNVKDKIADLPWSSWHEVDMTTGVKTPYRSFGWQVQRSTTRTELANTFAAISAFVTSEARRYIDKVRDIVGARECYYQGIDGLIITARGRTRLENAGLVSETDIGKFKLLMMADNGIIRGVSDYRLGNRVVLAGRSQLRSASDSASDLQCRFHTKSHLFSGRHTDGVIEEWADWQRKSNYWKGTVCNGGWISPIVFDNKILSDTATHQHQTQTNMAETATAGTTEIQSH